MGCIGYIGNKYGFIYGMYGIRYGLYMVYMGYIYMYSICVYTYIYTSVIMCVNKDICKLDIVHGL